MPRRQGLKGAIQHGAIGTEQDEWSYKVRFDILQVSQSEMVDSEQRSTRRVLESTEQSIDVQIFTSAMNSTGILLDM
jgi:hypothetical protein